MLKFYCNEIKIFTIIKKYKFSEDMILYSYG